MLKTLIDNLHRAEEDYDKIYQIECGFKDAYSYRRIKAAEKNFDEAAKKLSEFILLTRICEQNKINPGLIAEYL